MRVNWAGRVSDWEPRGEEWKEGGKGRVLIELIEASRVGWNGMRVVL